MNFKPFNTTDPVRDATHMQVGDHVLHGDVIIKRVSTLDSEFDQATPDTTGVLAEGEHTGHAHQLFPVEDRLPISDNPQFDLRRTKNGKAFLRLVEPMALRHQEHAPIVLPPGDYHVGIQQERDPFEKVIRSVLD